MKKKLLERIEVCIFTVIFITLILFVGHLDATYTINGEVYSVNRNEITFIDKTNNLFSCYTEEDNPKVHEGENYILKFSHKGTESDRTDDGLIGYGKHSFLCFVW